MDGNRRKNRKFRNPGASFRAPWGSLFSPPENNKTAKEPFPPNVTFYMPEDDEEEEEPRFSLMGYLWQRFNFWATVALLLFLAFIFTIGQVVAHMWTPQNMRDISGYNDKGRGGDIAMVLNQSKGEELVFTEAEINRYLRDTCRLRQTGIFSIIAHAQGVAVRIHDGYAELVIDRMLGANIHQTTSVHISLSQEMKMGSPALKAELRGGPPILGSIPCGGSIGTLPVPARHIRILLPALETLLACYPDITRAIELHGYLPQFHQGGEGEDNYVRLVPHRPEESFQQQRNNTST